MKIAAAQINPTIGDFAGNVDKVLSFVSRAREMEAQLVVFPEMSLTGYPPRDLLERSWFVEQNLDALNKLASKVKDIGVIVGFVDKNTSEGKPLYNAAALIENGDKRRSYDGTLKTPLFLGSSTTDAHVPQERVEQSAEVFGALGAAVTLRLYPNMEHTVNLDEIEFVKGMIASVQAGGAGGRNCV